MSIRATLRVLFLLVAVIGLSGCESGNPLKASEDGTAEAADATTDENTNTETGIGSSGDLTPGSLPGTQNPTSSTAIVRYEEVDGEGGGYARNITYDNSQGQDQFSVDNLAFDGDNSYVRGGTANAVNSVGQLGPFQVYEADAFTVDPVTGNQLGTLTYRALYGRSASGQTEFAIVRTGSYVDYGFGGFVYERNGTDANGNTNQLVLPDEGDAEYRGDYAGIRVFNNRTGLEYVTGDAQMFVDFKDFNNDRRGVALYVTGRRLYDINGNDITQPYLDALAASHPDAGSDTAPTLLIETDAQGNVLLPDLNPVISPTSSDQNGEIVQEMRSYADFSDGSLIEEASAGQYYAVMSGQNAEEIVGVLVVSGEDPRVDGAGFQETGGFIVVRQ